MAFNPKEARELLAATGRRCCVCGTLYIVQLHHIVPVEHGGSDEIDNAIPLCPNCHALAHLTGEATTHLTKKITAEELRFHRERTLDLVAGRTPAQRVAQGRLAIELEWVSDREAKRNGYNIIVANRLDRTLRAHRFYLDVSEHYGVAGVEERASWLPPNLRDPWRRRVTHPRNTEIHPGELDIIGRLRRKAREPEAPLPPAFLRISVHAEDTPEATYTFEKVGWPYMGVPEGE